MNRADCSSHPPETQRRINIVQGEFHVTEAPDVVLTTILGSCVAACLCDTLAGVGGMNHFLLPGDETRDGDVVAMRHGVHAMELLVNGLLQRGARRERLQAKLFGGACMMQGLADVGRMNADFAERFIRRERIAMTGGSLRGTHGRRIQYWPVTGRARQMTLGHAEATVFATERQIRVPPQDAGGVELF
jgi:chemotaxis protein CheD